MASAGPNTGATAANDSSNGSALNWSGSANAVSSNDARASITLSSGSVNISRYLKITNFGFAIPTGATIDGIVAEIEAQSSTGTKGVWEEVRLVKASTVTGSDLSSAIDLPASDTFVSHGGATELWGETWSSTDINSSGFGVAISVTNASASSQNALIDSARITVYYTLPGSLAMRSTSIPMSIMVR